MTFNQISLAELAAKFHIHGMPLNVHTPSKLKRLTKSQSSSGFCLRSSLNAEKTSLTVKFLTKNFVCKLATPSFRVSILYDMCHGKEVFPETGSRTNMYPRLHSSHPGIVFMEALRMSHSQNQPVQPFSPRALSDEGVQRCQVLYSQPNSDLRGPSANSLDSLCHQSFNQGCNTCKA